MFFFTITGKSVYNSDVIDLTMNEHDNLIAVKTAEISSDGFDLAHNALNSNNIRTGMC